ncbi:DUF2892 domain-containing protein [Natrialbaceae archaeon A-CW2]|uniref:YgaP family membrane protein n=1 Tax=Natronosalvus amylolyticus TaxID=2961994 RepID=UPI0020CA1F89|nr:DUF2892 domain-containing protein [Natronosalvus amylolyticus]
METNVGGLDRTGRIAIGILLIAAGALALAGYWGIGLGVGVIAVLVGAILLVTGTTRKCPVNQAVGIDTSE